MRGSVWNSGADFVTFCFVRVAGTHSLGRQCFRQDGQDSYNEMKIGTVREKRECLLARRGTMLRAIVVSLADSRSG